IGDKAYDSDTLDESLKEQGIEMIAPHRANRTLKSRTSAACGAMHGAGWWNAISHGYSGNADSACVGSTTPAISSVSWSSPALRCSSSEFEIGSSLPRQLRYFSLTQRLWLLCNDLGVLHGWQLLADS